MQHAVFISVKILLIKPLSGMRALLFMGRTRDSENRYKIHYKNYIKYQQCYLEDSQQQQQLLVDKEYLLVPRSSSPPRTLHFQQPE